MRFSADSYFCIGAAHVTAGKPCQDYALSRSTDDSACAVVSDGCSTGGHTDIGSRIMALATIRTGRGSTQGMITEAQDLFGLSSSDLLATRIYAFADTTGGYFHIQGDGAVAIKTRSGAIWMTHYEWRDNTPFYPAYSDADRQRFIQVHGNEGEYRFLTTGEVRCVDNAGIARESAYTVAQGMYGIGRPFSPEELGDIDLIAVFSDGVSQIENVTWQDAMVELLAMKSLAGEFVKRRAMAAIRKWKESGKGPIDDFSMAVIYIDHD